MTSCQADVVASTETPSSSMLSLTNRIDVNVNASLTKLPLELLHSLCSGLPFEATTSLSNTCAALHPIASAFAWVHLKLTRQIAHCEASGWLATGGQRFTRIESSRVFDGIDLARELMAGLLTEVQRRLEARAERKGAVRKLSFNDDDMLCNAHSDLLKLVAPSLRELRWMRIALLENAPHLRTLTIVPTSPYAGGWGLTIAEYNPSPKFFVWPSLPFLCELEIGEMELEFLPFLTSLVRSAPGLRRVTIGDPMWKWAPNKVDTLLEALSKLSWLAFLAVSASVRDVLGEIEGFHALRTVSVVETFRPWSSTSEQIESLEIPALPTVKHYISELYLTGSDPWDANCYHGEHVCLATPVQPLPNVIVRQLEVAASVETIRFIGCLDSEDERHFPYKTAAYWGSPKSFEKSDHVVLVRTYSNKEGWFFTHCRRYTAQHTRMCDDTICRHQDVWEEFADFAGISVPGGLFAEVYAVCGMPPFDWTTPGRNLTMPEEAWDMLDRWWISNDWLEWANLNELFGYEGLN